MKDYYICDSQWLKERNPKWLQDDYVKFIRWGQWRIEKTGQPGVTQTEARVHDEERVSLPARPDLLRTKTACEVCAKPLVEVDYLLCSDCSRALTILLDLLGESAPLVQSWLDAHSELTPEDLNRIREVFTWRSNRMGLRKPKAQAHVTVTS